MRDPLLRVCKKRGCREESIRRSFPNGLVRICRRCERCASHCHCDVFMPAVSEEDIELAAEERAQELEDAERY